MLGELIHETRAIVSDSMITDNARLLLSAFTAFNGVITRNVNSVLRNLIWLKPTTEWTGIFLKELW